MIVEVDRTTIPPRVTLRDPNDFQGFKVVAKGDHAFVKLDELNPSPARSRLSNRRGR